jgi:hypothetical protein
MNDTRPGARPIRRIRPRGRCVHLSMFVFPQPQYIACAECGACVPRWESDEHVCDEERWLDYQLVRLRPHIARFEADFREWLTTGRGQFELYYARRSRSETSVTGARQAKLSHA